jgi:hypothetical protein
LATDLLLRNVLVKWYRCAVSSRRTFSSEEIDMPQRENDLQEKKQPREGQATVRVRG